MSRNKTENYALCKIDIYFLLQDEVNIYGAKFYYSKHRAEGAFMKSAGNAR